MNIKKTIIGDIIPRYKAVHFFINAGYEWGQGWTIPSDPFNEEMYSFFKKEDWDLHVPSINSCSSLKVYSSKGYLFVHPMELSGYLTTSAIADLKVKLNQLTTFKLMEVKVGADVYGISDHLLNNLYQTNIDYIHNIILAVFRTKRKNQYMYSSELFELYKKITFQRNTPDGFVCGYSSGSWEYIFLENEFKALIRLGKIEECPTKNGCYRTK